MKQTKSKSQSRFISSIMMCFAASAAHAQPKVQPTLSQAAEQTAGPLVNTSPAPAASGSPPPTALGEVVVTARKTTENVQKAPASIVAISGLELKRQGITDPQALEKALPSAELRSEGPVVQSFIRGVGSNIDVPNVQPAVAFVFDGVPVPRYGTQGLLFDVTSVQVISGPQGTLYGGTAAGGAINVNTAQPRNSLTGDGLVETGNYGLGHLAVDQNFGIGENLSLRTSVDYDRHDGYQSFNLDALNNIQGRLSLLAKPTGDLTALVFFNADHQNGEPEAASNKPFYNSSDPWELPAFGSIYGNSFSAKNTFENDKSFILGANVEWRLGQNVFTYIPGFVRIADDYTDYAGGLPLSVHNDEDQHTEELRWARNVGQLKLSGGMFYSYDRINFYDLIAAPVLPAPPYLATIPVNVIPYQANTSYAGYGQVVFTATPSLRFTAGARYTYTEVKAEGDGTVGRSFLPFKSDAHKDHPDWKVGVDYDFAPRILVYANAQTGAVPIGYAVVPSTPTQSNYVPEARLLAFSGGAKSRLFNNHLELNSEIYYYDYLNFQAVNFDTQTGITTALPARRSTIYGDETSIRVLLSADTEIDAGINVMSAKYDEFSGPGFNYAGNQLIDAPGVNVNAGLQHEIRVLNFGSLLGRVQSHYESGHWGVFQNAPGTHQFAYTKTDLSATYMPLRGRWSVQAYVDNVEDQAVFGPLDPGGQPGPAAGPLEPPRTFGIRLLSNWG